MLSYWEKCNSINYLYEYVRTRKQGGRGRQAPCKKNDVILRRRPQAAMPLKDLVTSELFLGCRGAVRGNLHCIIVK